MAEPQSLRELAQSRTPFGVWVGVVMLFSLFGLIALAVVGPSPRGPNYEQARAKVRAEKLKTLRDQENSTLIGYAWVSKEKGTARIPIERAMELTVAELAQKKPMAAGPIATPQPEGAPAAATGVATPAAGPTASPQQTGTPKPTAVAGPKSEIGNQPAAAANPPGAPPGTQPGAAASPAASAPPPAAKPAASPPAKTGPSPPPPQPPAGQPPGQI